MIVAWMILSGCKTDNLNQQSEHPEKIVTKKITDTLYQPTIRTTGSLKFANESRLSFKTGGLIQHVNVEEGEKVKKGQILAKLDLTEISAQKAMADVEYEKAIRDFNRIKILYNDSVATTEQWENIQSLLKAKEAQKQVADFNFHQSLITAPRNGIILKVLLKEDEMAAPGHPVVLFGSTDTDAVVVCALSDKDRVMVTKGDTAKVWFDAYTDKILKARISTISAFADPYTGTFETELELLNQDSHTALFSGLFAYVEIFTSHSTHALAIPYEAINGASGTGFVNALFIDDLDSVYNKQLKVLSLQNDFILTSTPIPRDWQIIIQGGNNLNMDKKIIRKDSE